MELKSLSTLATLEVTRRHTQELGPFLIPDDVGCASLLFPHPDEHIGYSIDTWVAPDYGTSPEVYAGGCGRMGRTAKGYRGLRSSGLSFVALPPGRNRVLRVVVTSLNAWPMQGLLAVGPYTLPVFVGTEHHSVAFDAAGGVSGGNNQTSLTTGAATIAGTERVAVLGLGHGNNTSTSFTGSVGGVGGSLIAGTDAGTTGTTRTLMFGVTAPPTGSQTGTMSWTTADDSNLGYISATGVDQTTPFTNGTFNNTDGSNNGTVTVSSATGDMTVAIGCAANGPGTITTATQTERWNGDTGSTRGAGSTAPGAATNVHNFTAGAGNATCTSGCNIKQATASTSVTPSAGAAVLTGIAPSRVVGTVLTPVTP